MNVIKEVFGKKVFNDEVMKERLPRDAYRALKKHIEEGTELDGSAANAIAAVMKDWALENGATHFTHWFQPMTGVTAEKHDSFIVPGEGDSILMNFSGKELIKGEPDASSFPSGGIRATFEARGYTAWDPSSHVFLKGRTLCIPTAFCSYGGEALDKKTPLLISMEAINKQAVRLLSLLGKPVKKVIVNVGAEQEYFLIPRELYKKRKDLILCGRTLLGAKPPKSQELDDHYFGSIKSKIAAYMEELNRELWQLGVMANTEHNEVAPSQYELAPVFSSANIATDHNQLIMETMKQVAEKHGLVCLLHEKPFAGINGSGKHINWSLAADGGENLLKPGKKPMENIQFLLFLCAVIKGVDEYQDLLRISVGSAGNDHRLGGNEAPPAILSMFLGDDLLEVMEAIEKGETAVPEKPRFMDMRASVLPYIKKDTTDRNRTSSFAFTGSRFEFRMPGSETSVSCPIYILNTIVAEELRQFADALAGSDDLEKQAMDLIKETYARHKRIIFNGNSYSEEWVKEAEKRKLLNMSSFVDAIPLFTAPKNLELFKRHGIFSKVEAEARQAIFCEEYAKIIHIEALTLLNMVKKEIVPAAARYTGMLAETALSKRQLCGELGASGWEPEKETITLLSDLGGGLFRKTQDLETLLESISEEAEPQDAAMAYCHKVLPAMEEVRSLCDQIEQNTSADYWPMPTYAELLFS